MTVRQVTSVPLALIGLLALSLAGCWQNPGQRLIGTWEGRPEAVPDNPALDRKDEILLRQMRLEFHNGSRVTLSVDIEGQPPDSRQGRWSLAQGEGNRLTIDITAERDDTPQTEQLEVVFDGDNKFTARQFQGDHRMPAVIFTRVE